MEKNLRNRMYMYRTEPLCYAAEMGTILYIKFNFKKGKKIKYII